MKLRLLPLLLAAPGSLFASYIYYYTDTLTTINTANWYQNGSLTATTGGLTAPTASGGALISKVAVPGGGSDYEINSTLTIPASGGTYVQLIRGTTNAISGPAAGGTYYSIEVQNPTWANGYCSATLAVYKRVSNTVTLLTSTSINCYDGMVVRTVVRGGNLMAIRTSPYSGTIYGWPAAVTINDSSITVGAAGVGAYNTPSGNTIKKVELGPIDTIAPSAVAAQSVAMYSLPNRVEMQWQGVADDANGIGLWDYQVYRNGTYIGQTFTPEFDDDAVAPATTYTYTIQAEDAHQNLSTNTTFIVVTPPAGAIDARRIGIRPLGSYWGAAGEQIDMLSGNVNFTYPMLTAMGRNGWSATFALNYNSQLWRQDAGGTWKLGRDEGYGFGWRLMAGSITPIWTTTWTLDHFIYTDSTGAEYRLDQYNAPNCMWTSTEGVRVGYNPCVNRLYFPDGSFWSMGATSGGIEQDAGVLYPTLMEDPNGNQVTILYQNGISSPTSNSSARITSIQDVRGGGGPTYTFTYSTDPIPHLTNIDSPFSGIGSWGLTYLTNQPLNSPFSPPVAFGTTTLLSTANKASDGLPPFQFQYGSNGSGELTQVTTTRGGILAWGYRNFTYTGSRTFREVQNRYLTMQSGGTQYTYPFTRNDAADAGLSIHSGITLDDAGGIGEKAWTFATTGSTWQLGLPTRYEDRPSAAQASHPLQRKDYTWVQDGALTPYIGTALTTLDPAGTNVQTKTTQTMDAHGNVTQTNIYDFNNLATAARTYNYLYNYSFTGNGFTSYRLTSAKVTSGSQTVTLVSNGYDTTALTNVTPIQEHDATYGTSVTARGNLTVTTPVGGPTTTINRDIAGNVVSATDGLGHSVSTTLSVTTNFVAPDIVTPNSNTNLNHSMTYYPTLSLNSLTSPNSSVASANYDAWNRFTSTTSIYGAVTNYTYSGSNTIPSWQQATTNSHWVQTTFDGFDRAAIVGRGYNDTGGGHYVSWVSTVYAPCACSPVGKMQKITQPYGPTDTPVYTTYTYDGLGRTLNIVAPDGASTTTYAYSASTTGIIGTTTTITDPAGKWKKYTYDVFGNLRQVNEPNPAGGADYVTTYTYDFLNHLTQVSMPRPNGTQNRTFVYDSNQRLQSETHPESGTKTYTYNADGTLASRTDAKGQVAKYIYDPYQRMVMIQHFTNSSAPENLCDRLTIAYDAGTNGWGRPYSYTMGDSSCGQPWSYVYGYTPGGQIAKKTLNVVVSGASTALAAGYTYDNEGKMTSVAYPNPSTGQPSTVPYAYTFDAMDRPTGLGINGNPIVQSAQYGPSDELLYWQWGMNAGSYSETRHYNSLLQLTEQSFGAGFYDLKYVYSANQNNGKILQQLETVSGETTNYTYDSLNRLVTASTGAWGQSFTYDGFGNLTDKNVTAGSAPTLHALVNPATNQISTAAYDLNGNLLYFQAGTSYAYDQENRLTAFITATTEGYSYGPDNERIWRRKLDGTQEVYFYGATGERLATYQPGGPTLVEVGRNMYFAGRPVSLAGYQNQYQPYVGADRLGTVRWSGDYQYHTTKFSYYPYGEEYTTTPQEREKFGTYYRDGSTGLDYARNRYYASTYGRFMTADPYLGSAKLGDPQSWNLYSYATGDPVNRNDPSGTDPSYGPVGYCDLSPFTPPCQLFQPTLSTFVSPKPMMEVLRQLQLQWQAASRVAYAARDYIVNKKSWSAECEEDLVKAGVTTTSGVDPIGQLKLAASAVTIVNGVESGDKYVSLIRGADADAAYTRATTPPDLTVSQFMASNMRTTALAQAPGNLVYIRPSDWASFGSGWAAGTLMHELLHNLVGLGDIQLENNMGISPALAAVQGSTSITLKLLGDCFNK